MSRTHGPRRDRGFTLLELLVVVAIVAVLAAVLLPVLERAREEARFVQCASQQRQIFQAAAIYAQDHDGKLPDRDGKNAYPNWKVTVAGYPPNPNNGREYAHGSRIIHNHMTKATGDRLDAIGAFMQRYMDAAVEVYQDPIKKQFASHPNAFHCPSTALPAKGAHPQFGTRRAISYFLAGFGVRQIRSIYGWSSAEGNRDYPTGWPRLARIQPIDGRQVGMIVDLFNHAPPQSPEQGRGNITATDGSVRSFDYGAGGMFKHGEIYVPADFTFPLDGMHVDQDYHKPIKYIRYMRAGNNWGYYREVKEFQRFGYSFTGR